MTASTHCFILQIFTLSSSAQKGSPPSFFLCLPCPFRMWSILVLKKLLSLVADSSFTPFPKPSTTYSTIHSKCWSGSGLIISLNLDKPCVCYAFQSLLMVNTKFKHPMPYTHSERRKLLNPDTKFGVEHRRRLAVSSHNLPVPNIIRCIPLSIRPRTEPCDIHQYIYALYTRTLVFSFIWMFQ